MRLGSCVLGNGAHIGRGEIHYSAEVDTKELCMYFLGMGGPSGSRGKPKVLRGGSGNYPKGGLHG